MFAQCCKSLIIGLKTQTIFRLLVTAHPSEAAAVICSNIVLFVGSLTFGALLEKQYQSNRSRSSASRQEL